MQWIRRYGQKNCQIGVPKRIFEKISRNMIYIEKMLMTNNVFGMEVLAHHPEKVSLAYKNLLTFIRFLELSFGYEA